MYMPILMIKRLVQLFQLWESLLDVSISSRFIFSYSCTAMPYKVDQGARREPPVLKTGAQQCEHDPCNVSRFSLWLNLVFPVRIWAQRIPVFITGTGSGLQCMSFRYKPNQLLKVLVGWKQHPKYKFSGQQASIKEVQIVYRLFLLICYLLNVPRLPSFPAS